MKITSYDIHTWAKKASDDFILNGIPLNSGLVKIARENGLNKEQVSRLVERTNAATYVSKMNNADDGEKYIEFPVAETRKIATKLDYQEPKTSTLEDYRTPPEKSAEHIKLSQLFPGVEEKEEEIKLTDHQKYLIKRAALDALNHIETTKREIAMIFDLESNSFIENVKRASLQPDTCFKSVSDHLENMPEDVATVIKPLLKQAELKLPDQYKQREVENNLDLTKLEKQASYLQQVIMAYKNLDDSKEGLVKKAAEKKAFGLLGNVASKLFTGAGATLQAIAKSRLAMGATFVGGAALTGGGLAVAHATGKEKGLQEKSPLKTLPPRYNKWRP